MASLVYDSYMRDTAQGSIVIGTDSFKCMLVSSAYTPSKSAHAKRSDVTNEVSGTNYTAGGTAVTLTGSLSGSDRWDVTIGSVSWANATITARGAVIYKSRGGASSADELVCYLDFGADVTSTSGTFQISPSSPLRLQN